MQVQVEEKILHKVCPICLSEKLNLKYEKIKGAYSDENYYDILECQNCKMQFVSEQISEEILFDYYNRIKESDLTYTNSNLGNLTFYYKRLKNRIEKYITKGNVLDIGCSSGYFLDIMNGGEESNNWNCYGCEISSKFAKIAKEKFHENIFEGSFENYEIKDNFFDVITLQDSLDHMPNAKAIVEKCFKMLKSQGIMVIKVHNIDCLLAKITRENFYAIFPPEHLFYFSKKSMKILAEKIGFDILKIEFIPHILNASTCFLRLSQNQTQSLPYKIYNFLENSNNKLIKGFANFKIYKNFNDIMTVFLKKP